VTVPAVRANGTPSRTDPVGVVVTPPEEAVSKTADTTASSKTQSTKRRPGEDRSARKRKDDAKLYVAPRPPDDPGTDGSEQEVEGPLERGSFGAVN
jgi:HemY protein